MMLPLSHCLMAVLGTCFFGKSSNARKNTFGRVILDKGKKGTELRGLPNGQEQSYAIN